MIGIYCILERVGTVSRIEEDRSVLFRLAVVSTSFPYVAYVLSNVS
jgi:hypothetical protein